MASHVVTYTRKHKTSPADPAGEKMKEDITMKKITGIKALCSATKDLSPVGYAPKYKLQVHVDKATGKLYWADIVGNGTIQYHDDDLIYLCDIEHPATMAEIRDMIQSSWHWPMLRDSLEV